MSGKKDLNLECLQLHLHRPPSILKIKVFNFVPLRLPRLNLFNLNRANFTSIFKCSRAPYPTLISFTLPPSSKSQSPLLALLSFSSSTRNTMTLQVARLQDDGRVKTDKPGCFLDPLTLLTENEPKVIPRPRPNKPVQMER